MRNIIKFVLSVLIFSFGCQEKNSTIKKLDNLYALNNLENLDTKGWSINYQTLMTPKRNVSPYIFLQDTLIESNDSKYACLFYTIFEASMNSYIGLIAVFKDKDNPKLVLNPINQWFYFHGANSIVFYKNFLVLRKVAYNEDKSLSGLPFLIVDLEKEEFGFIDFDYSSIHYSINFQNNNECVIKFDIQNDIENLKSKNRNDEVIQLNSINFYDLRKANDMVKLYWSEKQYKK